MSAEDNKPSTDENSTEKFGEIRKHMKLTFAGMALTVMFGSASAAAAAQGNNLEGIATAAVGLAMLFGSIAYYNKADKAIAELQTPTSSPQP